MQFAETLVESARKQHVDGIRNEVGRIKNAAAEGLEIDRSVRGDSGVLGEPECAVTKVLDDQERPLHQLVHKHSCDATAAGWSVVVIANSDSRQVSFGKRRNYSTSKAMVLIDLDTNKTEVSVCLCLRSCMNIFCREYTVKSL